MHIQRELKHLLAIKDLTAQQIRAILARAQTFITPQGLTLSPPSLLKHKTVVNLFFENSTRTRCSFELAAKRLGAHVLNFDSQTSSTQKGESLLDTVYTLQAMDIDLLVVRHAENGIAKFIAEHVNESVAVINAGDGNHEHPTQALLDLFTIQQYKTEFSKLSVAILGDIAHSRVAHSLMYGLLTLGVQDIRLIGPRHWLPTINQTGVKSYDNLAAGIVDVDVIVALRIQVERIQEKLQLDFKSYVNDYCLTEAKLKLAKPSAIVMHPGPMNRGVEIESNVADGKQSVILQQVRNGIAVRMAVMSMLLTN